MAETTNPDSGLGWRWVRIEGKWVEIRICYAKAWDDPAWRRTNGLPERLRKDGRRRG